MSARNLDAYLQGELRPSERLALTMGARQSDTTLNATSNNALPTLGSHTYQATTGMVSAQYYVQSNTNVYVSYGSGFDTPTLNQIIYSPSYVNYGTTNTGNLGLEAARTQQVEIGIKSEISATAQAKVALFDSDTTNDIVIAASNGGKSAYLNAPKTSRKGMELSTQWQLPYQLQASLAYTYLDAKVVQAYTQNITNPSGATTSSTIDSGNRIPGVPDQGLVRGNDVAQAGQIPRIRGRGQSRGQHGRQRLEQGLCQRLRDHEPACGCPTKPRRLVDLGVCAH